MKSKADFEATLNYMLGRGFISNNGEGKLLVKATSDDQTVKQAFLCNLILPYIETYAIVLGYFSLSSHISLRHEEEMLYKKI